MQAFAIDQFNTVGSIHEMEKPDPSSGEILVKVAAAGVNPVDWKVRDGGGDTKRPFPFILGQDFSGTVEQIGKDVNDVAVGDRVFGMARQGGSYAQYTTVANDGKGSAYARTPTAIADPIAAALPTAGLTAMASLAWLKIKEGSSIVIVGATGGVGAIATQLASARGAHVTAIVSSAKAELAASLGAHDTIAYDKVDAVTALRSSNADGVDAVLDLVSDGEKLKEFAAILKPDGRLVSTIHVVDEAWFSSRGYAAKNIALPKEPEASSRGLAELAATITSGALHIALERTDALADAPEVLEESRSGKLGGKAVLIP